MCMTSLLGRTNVNITGKKMLTRVLFLVLLELPILEALNESSAILALLLGNNRIGLNHPLEITDSFIGIKGLLPVKYRGKLSK